MVTLPVDGRFVVEMTLEVLDRQTAVAAVSSEIDGLQSQGRRRQPRAEGAVRGGGDEACRIVSPSSFVSPGSARFGVGCIAYSKGP